MVASEPALEGNQGNLPPLFSHQNRPKGPENTHFHAHRAPPRGKARGLPPELPSVSTSWPYPRALEPITWCVSDARRSRSLGKTNPDKQGRTIPRMPHYGTAPYKSQRSTARINEPPQLVTLLATVVECCEGRRERGPGHPPTETVRVLATLRQFLREGTPWRSLRATKV